VRLIAAQLVALVEKVGDKDKVSKPQLVARQRRAAYQFRATRATEFQ
jgi:hypothetical protein